MKLLSPLPHELKKKDKGERYELFLGLKHGSPFGVFLGSKKTVLLNQLFCRRRGKEKNTQIDIDL